VFSPTSVFFDLFAAGELSQMFALLMEPYAMIQVSSILLRYPIFCNKPVKQ